MPRVESHVFEGPPSRGVPSVAVSLARDAGDFGTAARIGAHIAARVLERQSPYPPEDDLGESPDADRGGRRRGDRVVLNVNVPGGPPDSLGEVRLTRLGRRVYLDSIVEKTDPRGGRYFWIAGDPAWIPEGHHVPTDIETVRAGDISVTPLQLDATDDEALDVIGEWSLGGWPRGAGV